MSETTITVEGGGSAAEYGEPAAEGEAEEDGGGDEGQEGAGGEGGGCIGESDGAGHFLGWSWLGF